MQFLFVYVVGSTTAGFLIGMWVYRTYILPKKIQEALNTFVVPWPKGTWVRDKDGLVGRIERRITQELGDDYCYDVTYPELGDFLLSQLHSKLELAQ